MANIYPATSTNALLADYQSKQLGMFISFGMTTYTPSDSYGVNSLINPPTASTFAAPSTVDSAQWVTDAVNAGADYVVLTSGHHIGFNIFPYSGSFQRRLTADVTRGNLWSPAIENYDVRSTSADQNIIGKFANECVSQGMKFGLYYNIGKNVNLRREISQITGAYDETGVYSPNYLQYVRLVIDELTWLVNEYSPNYLWLDALAFFPLYSGNEAQRKFYMQDIYNRIKAIDPNVLIIGNYDPILDAVVPNGTDLTRPKFTFNGTEMFFFPLDVVSFESQRIPTTGADSPVTSHKGTNYYMPREVITSVLTSQYFAKQDNFNSLVSTVDLQNEYDNAQLLGAPFLLNVAVNMAGTIPADQLTRFATIVK